MQPINVIYQKELTTFNYLQIANESAVRNCNYGILFPILNICIDSFVYTKSIHVVYSINIKYFSAYYRQSTFRTIRHENIKI